MTKMKMERIERGGRMPALPAYQTAGAAAFDLAAFLDAPVTLAPGGRALIPTGLRFAVPEGFGGFILARSSLGAKHGVCLANGVGLIDSDYRGEIMVALLNTSDAPFTVRDGDRVAQFLLLAVPRIEPVPVNALDTTVRGEGGFGSTGRGSC